MYYCYHKGMKNHLLKFILFLYLFTQSVLIVMGQDSIPAVKDTFDIYEMSIQQLLDLKAHGVPSELEAIINTLIGVASKKPLSTRESPSIVTLITEEEIKNSGSRDLIDVLRLVPGFDFGVDVYGVVGVGVRGNWAHEGKVLLLWDGQEVNETLYGTIPFGNHFPVDQIKKIEIIRGPGSAIYGGFAEYGVINIITKNGEDLNGISVTGTYGQLPTDYGRRNINISGGKKWNDLSFKASSFIGQGQRSDGYNTDMYGNSYLMQDSSALNPSNFNISLDYKNLSIKGMADIFSTTSRDAYSTNLINKYPNNFYSYMGDIQYKLQINKDWYITPRITNNYQLPWNWEGPSSDEITAYDIVSNRLRGIVTSGYRLNRKINLIAGGELYNDFAKNKADTFYDGANNLSFYNMAGFGEVIIKHRLVNITLGTRYDYHNNYGSAVSPRFALTKKIKRFHFKFLLSNAFRAPSIENINSSLYGEMKPEKTRVVEGELGYQLTRNSILTINVFDITTKDPIIYYGINDSLEGYGHGEEESDKQTGTQGIELEYKHKEKWGSMNFNYSFYTAGNKSKPATYQVPDNNNFMLAFPMNKFNIFGNILITSNFSINPSVSYFGVRYGYDKIIDNEAVINKFDPVWMLNIYVRYNNMFIKGLSAGLGVFDILDKRIHFIQPYNSEHSPLPGPGREIVLKISYDFSFNKK